MNKEYVFRSRAPWQSDLEEVLPPYLRVYFAINMSRAAILYKYKLVIDLLIDSFGFERHLWEILLTFHTKMVNLYG